MQKNSEPRNIEELLADADGLIRQINLDAVKDLKEAHRLEFEKHVQYFKKIKSDVQGKKGTSGIGTGSEGMHDAIQDIVKAMHDLKNRFF
jgi:hypothetical protein